MSQFEDELQEIENDFEDVILPDNQKVILVGVCLSNDNYDHIVESLDELERLIETAGLTCVGKFVQRRVNPDRGTYIGKGFAVMMKAEMQQTQAGLLVFDNELSPMQSRNLEKEHEINAIDRTEIILQIFHQHARTREARLQVRLAELRYQLPRLKQLWGHFDREAGSARSVGGAASRGMGEKQSEIDKRRIREDISKIERLLTKIMLQEDTQRKQRQNLKKICLVGYTNAGKSTLFNQLTHAGVLMEDKLFATLDSTSRALHLGIGQEVVISDTVGFIARLPHHLVASFRATLREVVEADLLLHVVDISDTRYQFYINEVEMVLAKINASEVPTLIVANKMDKLSKQDQLFQKAAHRDFLFVSAAQNEGIEELIQTIDNSLHQSQQITLLIPFTEQRYVSLLHQQAKIVSQEYEDNGTRFVVELHQEDIAKFAAFIV